ncbi:hypothetical protein SAMN02745121_07502 [Nannocystis exedens]|uniref:KANL3/Tex30 alpha/beta hydrolase-like domain-containing protein n=1 Tax=Nannocystis exedens TaxID=54 RepID=A0A1I2GS56_9BACT|nr:alpha/beta family hydrolase [Nannocystis exedens]PCC74099.1 putative hydrolase of the alpha/beta superfamily protein [Nannocystis exedens]SFF20764.1 hypothetical protein SAMN02745121_07502 [Nannocystis exedens]
MSGEASVLRGPAGPLEAIYRALPGARRVAVLCHSHPEYGGSMYDRVLHRIACGLHAAGVSTLRFNFRGVEGSAGRFDGGDGEAEDVRAAIDRAARDHEEVALIGFSFGAWVGLRVGAGDPRVTRMVGLGLPVDVFEFGWLGELRRPLLLVHGTRDGWGAIEKVRALAAASGEAVRLVEVPGSDHVFAGHLDAAAAPAIAFAADALR